MASQPPEHKSDEALGLRQPERHDSYVNLDDSGENEKEFKGSDEELQAAGDDGAGILNGDGQPLGRTTPEEREGIRDIEASEIEFGAGAEADHGMAGTNFDDLSAGADPDGYEIGPGGNIIEPAVSEFNPQSGEYLRDAALGGVAEPAVEGIRLAKDLQMDASGDGFEAEFDSQVDEVEDPQPEADFEIEGM